jgi:hypothetical protein
VSVFQPARLSSFEPCLPRAAKQPPAGVGWIHEIKHDGFPIIVRRDVAGVLLLTRNGFDFAERFPVAAAAVAAYRHALASSTAKRSSPTRTDLRCSDLIRGHRPLPWTVEETDA